jgi:hypothetical protein
MSEHTHELCLEQVDFSGDTNLDLTWVCKHPNCSAFWEIYEYEITPPDLTAAPQ